MIPDYLLPASLRAPAYSWMAPDPSISINSTRVPLEVHVMTKCPDARDCLQMLVVPTMEKVWEKVDWKLSYIGK
jgi:hypothetical protein